MGIDTAVGYLKAEQPVLHGDRIPPGYKVVQLTWVQSPGLYKVSE